MKGRILLKALEILKEGVTNQIDFFEAVLASGYGANMGKIDYEYEKIQRAREKAGHNERTIKERKRRLQIFISKMKHDGLITEIDKNRKMKISKEGIQKLNDIKNRLPDRHYKKEKDSKLTIVSFDVPERLRRKRNWLREVLKNLGFSMIHQSVWVGKIKIPQEMIGDLEDLKILEFVEIFEISKRGSL